MKYINASTILPDELVEELQKYVQAGYIYIPAKDEQHKNWGELSGYRKELARRNALIIAEYRRAAYRQPCFCIRKIAASFRILWTWARASMIGNRRCL